jgi:hypothetical protein
LRERGDFMLFFSGFLFEERRSLDPSYRTLNLCSLRFMLNLRIRSITLKQGLSRLNLRLSLRVWVTEVLRLRLAMRLRIRLTERIRMMGLSVAVRLMLISHI